jgi:acyl dehydratase
MSAPRTRRFSEIRAGDELPPLEVPITATVIVAGAIASRDYMPVHHDKSYAAAQGSPDVFMNILTTNGYVARFLTDWAGPEAMLRSIAIRLGVPCFPGHTLRFTGAVTSTSRRDGEGIVEVALRGANALGDHCTGAGRLAFPDDESGA